MAQGPDEKMDPENDGKELEALSYQANDLAGFIRTLQADVKSLEIRAEKLAEKI